MLMGPRIILRDWIPEDTLPFTHLNADPIVMRYFAKRLSVDESVAMITRMREAIAKQGWGLWALEIGKTFAGFVGLARPSYETPFTPCVEIGWRLFPQYWGSGYATEAALVSLLYGFEEAGIEEIVSFYIAGEYPVSKRHESIRHVAKAGRRLQSSEARKGSPVVAALFISLGKFVRHDSFITGKIGWIPV